MLLLICSVDYGVLLVVKVLVRLCVWWVIVFNVVWVRCVWVVVKFILVIVVCVLGC